MRPSTYITVIAVAVGFLLSPTLSYRKNEYDISFWNLTRIGDTTMGEIGPWQKLQGGILKSTARYFSENYGGSPVMIDSILYRPEADGQYPALIVLHGSFGSADSMSSLAEEISRGGYVVLAVSGPGQGKSTGPSETNENRLNLTSGPYYGYYYRLLYSAMRGITFLTELPFVDSERIAAIGASQGGLECIWLSALDTRLKASISVVAAGDFPLLVERGSFALGHLPKGMRADDPRCLLLMRYFDPLAYAPMSKVPVLMLVGTSDEFFPLQSYNETFSALRAPKAINILPNTGHFVVKDEWIEAGFLWSSRWLKGEADFPEVSIESISKTSRGIAIRATGEGVDQIVVNYKESWPWSRWRTETMQLDEQGHIMILGNSPAGYVIYVAGIVGEKQVISSEVVRVDPEILSAASFFVFVVCLFSAIWLARLSLQRNWVDGIERSLIWLLFWLTYIMPLFIGASVIAIDFWKLAATFELWVPAWIPMLMACLLPFGLFFVSASEPWFRFMAAACTLLTTLVSMILFSYVGGHASLSLGYTLPVQIVILVSIMFEERLPAMIANLKRKLELVYSKNVGIRASTG